MRQDKRPEYFIPEKEIAKTPVFVSDPKANNAAKKSAETAQNSAEFMKSPRFQKIYEEYHNDVLQMKKTGKLPVNQKLKDDLSKMSGDERFEVID